MDRDATLRTLHGLVTPGGGIAILGSGGSDSTWTPPETPAVMDAVVKRWLGEVRRAGSGTYEHPSERYEVVVARSPFRGLEIHTVSHGEDWTVDELVGSLYSSSYASPFVLGANREAFESDLRARLAALELSGRFREDVTHHAI